jgi:hypothetical protein
LLFSNMLSHLMNSFQSTIFAKIQIIILEFAKMLAIVHTIIFLMRFKLLMLVINSTMSSSGASQEGHCCC